MPETTASSGELAIGLRGLTKRFDKLAAFDLGMIAVGTWAFRRMKL